MRNDWNRRENVLSRTIQQNWSCRLKEFRLFLLVKFFRVSMFLLFNVSFRFLLSLWNGSDESYNSRFSRRLCTICWINRKQFSLIVWMNSNAKDRLRLEGSEIENFNYSNEKLKSFVFQLFWSQYESFSSDLFKLTVYA